MSPDPGDLIGNKYEVVRLRGRGGNGAVYEAQNVLTGKRVAIKWLRASQATYEGARERMLREAQSAARVRHRHVVDIYDVGFDDGVVYLVMELLEGETLAELLSSRSIEIHRLIALLIPALRGVAAAHRNGVIHRDLKPENLFLASDPEHPEPRCVVLDFGVAKLSGSVGLTTPGYAVGTPIFMPVEQLVGGKAVDARSDVHAIGVILYVALTGRSPYEGETLRDMAMQMLTVEPVPVQRLRPELPLELCLTIQRSMSKEPSERPASIEALIADLAPYASADGEAWGPARDLRTRIVPGDLGTPVSRELDDPPLLTPERVLSAPTTEAAVSAPPRGGLDRRWWLAVAAAAIGVAALVWPREDRTPRAAVPTIVDAGSTMAAAPVSAPPASAPPELPPPEHQAPGAPPANAPRPPPRRAKLRKERAPERAEEPKPKNVRELSVDEFAIEE
jgi:eukaryotic-like serine/threonine-protein kinase